jgi:hypothetical protein
VKRTVRLRAVVWRLKQAAAMSDESARRFYTRPTDVGEGYNGTRLARQCDLMTILARVTQCPYVNCPHPPTPKVTPH